MRTPKPLTRDTVGSGPSPQAVAGPTNLSLDLEGDLDLGGFVFKDGVPFIHNDGGAADRSTAMGLNALVTQTGSAIDNTAFGYGALKNSTTGRSNTATGTNALVENTEGSYNTATGAYALLHNSSGSMNTASGAGALYQNTEGDYNTTSGAYALFHNTTGHRNTASGFGALSSNTTGYKNTASGVLALSSNRRQRNTANGMAALRYNVYGSNNTASGYRALFYNYTGSYNTAIGTDAGFSWTTGDNNIAVGRGATGVAGETETIRIGGNNWQSRTFIEGINEATSDDKVDGFDTDVCIDQFDQLGPCSVVLSSLRFKDHVNTMGDTATLVSALRPVTFHFKPKLGQNPDDLQYGLIAEEVAKVFPTLVTFDEEGKPYTVRYELLTPLLLNEVQRQETELEALRGVKKEVAELRKEVTNLKRKKRFRSD